MEGFETYIEENQKVKMGKPVIKGTRITVERILQKLAYGDSVENILTAYPFLNREQI